MLRLKERMQEVNNQTNLVFFPGKSGNENDKKQLERYT